MTIRWMKLLYVKIAVSTEQLLLVLTTIFLDFSGAIEGPIITDAQVNSFVRKWKSMTFKRDLNVFVSLMFLTTFV